MKQVFAFLASKKQEYANNKLMGLLDRAANGDRPLECLQALATVHAYFGLAFKDINDFVIKYPDPKDKFERAINDHAEEDVTHYLIFLDEWEDLGGDKLLERFEGLLSDEAPREKKSTSRQAMQLLWSDAVNLHNRKLAFDMCKQRRPVCAVCNG